MGAERHLRRAPAGSRVGCALLPSVSPGLPTVSLVGHLSYLEAIVVGAFNLLGRDRAIFSLKLRATIDQHIDGGTIIGD